MDVPIMSIKKIPMIMPPAYCEMCKVQCSTLYDLKTHKEGYRHKKNLKKFGARVAATIITLRTGDRKSTRLNSSHAQ